MGALRNNGQEMMKYRSFSLYRDVKANFLLYTELRIYKEYFIDNCLTDNRHKQSQKYIIASLINHHLIKYLDSLYSLYLEN